MMREMKTARIANIILGVALAWALGAGCDSGEGGRFTCETPADCPLPASSCIEATCALGACGEVARAAKSGCSDSGGKLCDGEGRCVGCLDAMDCVEGVCDAGSCSVTCDDGVKDGAESDVDCGGGVCAACENEKACAVAADCGSGFCDSGGGSPAGACAACMGDDDCSGATGTYCEAGVCTTKKRAGEACGAAGECASGFCPASDGVCCDASCDGECTACSAGKTGGSDGTCAAVLVGTDPDAECPAGDVASCGNSGDGCNGDVAASACKKYDAASECLAASCKDGIGTPAASCDGAGSCPASTPVPCAPYVCDGSGTACLAACAGDGDCVGGFYCNGASCVPQGNTGVACGANNQCSSGFCADGVCCNTACDGACDACSKAKGASTDGACSAVAPGMPGDPACAPYLCDGQKALCPVSCMGDSQCAAGNYCDNGACVAKKAKGVVCSAANQCATGFCSDAVCCNGACGGSCNACSKALGATTDGTCAVLADGAVGAPVCTPYLCDGNAAACPMSCAGEADCSTGNYCAANKCVAKKVNGISCAMAKECQSGNCIDGRCCSSTCGGACEACNLAGKEGACSLVALGADPANECVGHCNGAGLCEAPTYTYDAQPIYKKYCTPCHAMNGGSGSLKIADVYADAFLSSYSCAGKTKGACTSVRIKSGSMASGAGCTGDPVKDAANPKCLVAAEQATLDAWILGGMPQ